MSPSRQLASSTQTASISREAKSKSLTDSLNVTLTINTATVTTTLIETQSRPVSVSRSEVNRSRSVTVSLDVTESPGSSSATPTTTFGITETATEGKVSFTVPVFNGATDAIVVESVFTLRINGSAWGLALSQGYAAVARACVAMFAAHFGLPEEFVLCSNLRVGSLVVDLTLRRNASFYVPDAILAQELQDPQFNLTTLAVVYQSITNTTSGISMVESQLVRAASNPSSIKHNWKCETRMCVAAIAASVSVAVLICVTVGTVCICRHRQRRRRKEKAFAALRRWFEPNATPRAGTPRRDTPTTPRRGGANRAQPPTQIAENGGPLWNRFWYGDGHDSTWHQAGIPAVDDLGTTAPPFGSDGARRSFFEPIDADASHDVDWSDLHHLDDVPHRNYRKKWFAATPLSHPSESRGRSPFDRADRRDETSMAHWWLDSPSLGSSRHDSPTSVNNRMAATTASHHASPTSNRSSCAPKVTPNAPSRVKQAVQYWEAKVSSQVDEAVPSAELKSAMKSQLRSPKITAAPASLLKRATAAQSLQTVSDSATSCTYTAVRCAGQRSDAPKTQMAHNVTVVNRLQHLPTSAQSLDDGASPENSFIPVCGEAEEHESSDASWGSQSRHENVSDDDNAFGLWIPEEDEAQDDKERLQTNTSAATLKRLLSDASSTVADWLQPSRLFSGSSFHRTDTEASIAVVRAAAAEDDNDEDAMRSIFSSSAASFLLGVDAHSHFANSAAATPVFDAADKAHQSGPSPVADTTHAFAEGNKTSLPRSSRAALASIDDEVVFPTSAPRDASPTVAVVTQSAALCEAIKDRSPLEAAAQNPLAADDALLRRELDDPWSNVGFDDTSKGT